MWVLIKAPRFRGAKSCKRLRQLVSTSRSRFFRSTHRRGGQCHPAPSAQASLCTGLLPEDAAVRSDLCCRAPRSTRRQSSDHGNPHRLRRRLRPGHSWSRCELEPTSRHVDISRISTCPRCRSAPMHGENPRLLLTATAKLVRSPLTLVGATSPASTPPKIDEGIGTLSETGMFAVGKISWQQETYPLGPSGRSIPQFRHCEDSRDPN